jgi:hypothetical protein
MRKYHAPFWNSGRRSDPPIDCNTASHSQSHTVLYTGTSFRTLSVTYAMMEPRTSTEAKSLTGVRRGGRLCGALENGAACAHHDDAGA